MSPVAVYYDPVFLEHETGGHPENKRRLMVTRQALADSGLELEWVTPTSAPVSALTRIHDLRYVEAVRRLAEEGGGWLDFDTAVSPHSYKPLLWRLGPVSWRWTGPWRAGRGLFSW